MAELQGRVLKNYNGYYYLKVEGESEPYTCKVKGKMKKNRFSLATGDIAGFEVSSSEKREGMITGVPKSWNQFLEMSEIRDRCAGLQLSVGR